MTKQENNDLSEVDNDLVNATLFSSLFDLFFFAFRFLLFIIVISILALLYKWVFSILSISFVQAFVLALLIHGVRGAPVKILHTEKFTSPEQSQNSGQV